METQLFFVYHHYCFLQKVMLWQVLNIDLFVIFKQIEHLLACMQVNNLWTYMLQLGSASAMAQKRATNDCSGHTFVQELGYFVMFCQLHFNLICTGWNLQTALFLLFPPAFYLFIYVSWRSLHTIQLVTFPAAEITLHKKGRNVFTPKELTWMKLAIRISRISWFECFVSNRFSEFSRANRKKKQYI